MVASDRATPANRLMRGGFECGGMSLVPGRSGLRAGLLVAAIVAALVAIRLVIGAFLQLVQLIVVGFIVLVAAYAGYRLWTGWRRGAEDPTEATRPP